ncbi:hypothetical protein PHYPO_G00204400 [Pangasianodon hypophthalmus]|uniref:AF4/FMR2 C-terminal homology domain-containing protein n=1 Tax=Pangasianodon hypophthalmus TaxID=310915 RepID=A0A5N5PBC2_PANHP|nr:hypothetical protein PHYPO_G00204400 [Pangasianodon hypophthalmus]
MSGAGYAHTSAPAWRKKSLKKVGKVVHHIKSLRLFWESRADLRPQDMTHSWPSQQPPGGGGTERFLYSDSKEGKRHSTQHKQVRSDAPIRMPRVAPHKSMLADDLKLSSDEDDSDKGPHQIASWSEHHNLSGQHTHTHGRRARHSSSGSSGSDSSSESGSSSQRSRSPSPEAQTQPEIPSQPPPLTFSREDPSLTHWQLDKWLEKVHKTRQSDHNSGGGHSSGPGFDSDRVPSPGRYWERDSGLGTRESYSPSQSPVPSPRFDYSPRHSHQSSPGYSPWPSPGISPAPSPVPSVCPSPGASLRISRSPSPLPLHPPRSPSPSLTSAPASPRIASYTQVHQESSRRTTQATFTSSPVRQPKVRPWLPPDHNTQRINDSRQKDSRQPALPQHHSKHNSAHKETPHKPKSQSSESRSKSRSSPAPHQSQSSSRSNLSPKTKTRHSSSTDRSTEHSNRPSDHKSKLSQSLNSKPKPSPTPKLKAATETNSHSVHSSSSRPPPRPAPEISARSLSKPSSRLSPSTKPKTKSREEAVPCTRTSQKDQKPRDREPDLHSRGKAQGRAPVQTTEAQRHRRLAEEQLIRQRWLRSSEEEEEEEERRKEQGEREKKRRRRKEHNAEWQAVQPKQRPHTNSQHQPQTECSAPEREDQKRKKRRRSSEENSSNPGVIDSNPSPPLSPPSPTPVVHPTRQPFASSSSSSSSFSSSSSSESDSEPCRPPNVAKVPADSTSSQRLAPKQKHQQQCRPSELRSNDASPDEGQQHPGKHKLYTLVPFGRTEKSTTVSHRGLRNLVVKIDLSLLARVPNTSEVPNKGSSSSSSASSSAKAKEKTPMKHQYHQDQETGDAKSKRKAENGEAQRESKRSHVHTEKLPAPTHSADTEKQEAHSNNRHNDHHADYIYTKRPLSPLSPPTASKTQHSDQQHTNPPRDRDSTVKKTQIQKARPKIEAECAGVSGNTQPPSGTWSAKEPSYRGTVPYTDVSHHAEYYMHEAKRLKHRADAMVDKLGKAVNYVDAALSFMECGKAMEEGPLEAKSPYTMYAETVELIRYAMRLKSHTGPGARQEDKQLAVLCFRCLALLYWQMFRLKKDHALKYSKALTDYFKTLPKVPHTPPPWNDTTKGNGPPTCISPVGLTGSQLGSSYTYPFINIPHRIHQMAANHLNITNCVLYSYEYWEVADTLAKENKEFFNYLNTLTGPVTLHSSMAHIVQYTRQGLQWIRISANLS